MSNMRQLYQEVILDHNRKPRNFGPIVDANRYAEGHNPVCGDHISVSMNVQENNIEAIAFEGDACAICKASASMMTGAVKGKTVQDAEVLIEKFRGMTTGTLDMEIAAEDLGKLKVFVGVKDLPSRVKCAILPWHTLHAAMHSDAAVTTEANEKSVPLVELGDDLLPIAKNGHA